MKRIFFLAYILIIALTTSSVRAEDEGQKNFQKDIFSFSYPQSGWTLEEMAPPAGKTSTNIKLTAAGTPQLKLFVTWEEQEKAYSAEEMKIKSARLAAAFALPIVLKLGDEKQDVILSSVGLINISDLLELSYRFLISKPGTNKITSVEGFVFRTEDAPKSVVMGAIISEGSKVESEISDEYFDRLTEAYSIVNSIELKAKE